MPGGSKERGSSQHVIRRSIAGLPFLITPMVAEACASSPPAVMYSQSEARTSISGLSRHIHPNLASTSTSTTTITLPSETTTTDTLPSPATTSTTIENSYDQAVQKQNDYYNQLLMKQLPLVIVKSRLHAPPALEVVNLKPGARLGIIEDPQIQTLNPHGLLVVAFNTKSINTDCAGSVFIQNGSGHSKYVIGGINQRFGTFINPNNWAGLENNLEHFDMVLHQVSPSVQGVETDIESGLQVACNV